MSRFLLAAVLALVPTFVSATEPWADRALPISDDLLLWLDAARQPAAHKADDSALATGALVGVCYDGSGNRLHLVQRLQSAQPRLVGSGKHLAIRFDGKAAHLGLTNVRKRLTDFTLFVIAAPRSNAGFFRGLFAVNQVGKRDYSSGFCLDLTGASSGRLDCVNVEGKGFGGAVNLLRSAHSFGEFHTFEVACKPGVKGVKLALDGKAEGERDRQPGTMQLDEITLGARFYTNEPQPGQIRGFFDGDIAEVLLFDRLLSDAERQKVRAYLARKHAGLSDALRTGPPPRVVADLPPVQMLVPGFSVRQLPLDLPNINNLKYRLDGKLVALAYDGDVYFLSDTDKDGIEDKAEKIWDNKGRLRGPIGMALTPPDFKHGQGVLIASKGKVSLLVHGKGDQLEKEVVVASGWKELPHGVDALGVAVGKGGEVYFGLGTADFTNAYLLKDGKAAYDIKSERGSIVEVSPDLKARKVFASGIRFPVGLAFNRKGDLFATDQEGATWLPNGNPFDELLHIVKGRHYGFPPRHPKHLPSAVDEPSTFDYGPQHQSTCGLNFNGPTVFGPKHWADDAIVSGYSRGKLYRTQLAHTKEGYVARNHLLACLNMLTVDACVSPKGDLVIAVHSGQPDWGTGPAGKGRLYKVQYDGKDLPQPVAVWAASPREVRISFDREVNPEQVRDLARTAIIEHGLFVRAGDRFEKHRPGYAVVQQQQAAPRRRLAIHSVRLLDSHTLSLLTAPHPAAEHYAVTLPGLGRPTKPGKGELPQHAEVDLDYDLCGVEVTWVPEKGEKWSGWLPHLDPQVSKALLAGSGSHRKLWESLKGPGTLTLKAKLDLWQMLRPATQPGSKLDHEWPAEKVTVRLRSTSPFTAQVEQKVISHRLNEAAWTGTARKEPIPIAATLKKEEGEPTLHVTFTTAVSDTPRPLQLHRFLLPWAEMKPAAITVTKLAPELEGGNWLRGKRVFLSNEAACSRCHSVRGEGGKIGPDLTNLIHRDYASVLKDIRDPSAALNPDHIAYTVELNNGRSLTGAVRDGGDGMLIVGDVSGVEHRVKRDQVEKLTASRISVMPEGLDKALGPDKMRDLMTYLLTEPLAPARIEREGAPPARSRAEIAAAMKGIESPGKAAKKLRILLASGPKDHGPGEHDYPLWQRRWYNLLSLAEGVSVELVQSFPKAAQLAKADVVVFYSNNPGWSNQSAKDLDAFLARGGGAVYLHYAVDGHRETNALAKLIGLAWRGGQSKFRHGEVELNFSDLKSPISRGLKKVKFTDESYWQLVGDEKDISVVATGIEDGKPRPLMWTRTHGKGRVFVSILGHYNWTFDDPLFRLLVLRGLCWSAGEPADRLSELITIGARLKE